uniref:Calpain catalytic domain-containing protein n=1 Tax=Cyprinodon variegatus TaxID=28743 RepID=A0A3Q2CKD2_CYPVA
MAAHTEPGSAVKFMNQDFQALKEECLQNRTLFQDPMFPAEPASLGFKELGPLSAKTRGVEWKRPTGGDCRLDHWLSLSLSVCPSSPPCAVLAVWGVGGRGD